jgi:transcriptional regulator with XRE-family HTH domain
MACQSKPEAAHRKKSKANQALGQTVRTIRLQRGYNQERFAQRVGMQRSNYGAIERGEFNVTVDTVVKIATGLEVSVAELFERAGDSPRA